MSGARAIPCPDCGCGPSCLVNSDDHSGDLSKWAQESGTWANSSGRLDPPDVGIAYLRFLTPVPTIDTDGYKWSFVVNFGSGNGTIRAVVDQIDGDTTYKIYAEIIATSATAYSIRLWKETAGSAFAFSSLKTVDSIVRANDAIVSVCVVGTRVTASIRQGLFACGVTNTTTLHTGGATSARFVGIEIFSIHSSARIDDCALSRVGGVSECSPCDMPCDGCTDDSAPPALQVDLSGFTGVLAGVNGSYVIPYNGCDVTMQAASPCNHAHQDIAFAGGAIYRMDELTEFICTDGTNTASLLEVCASLNMDSGPLIATVKVRVKNVNSGFPGFCGTEDYIFNLDVGEVESCFDVDDDLPYTARTASGAGTIIGTVCGTGTEYTSASAHVAVAA